jgi:phage-related baseplate assembly protein
LINESAKQNLPRFAVGKNLDSLGELFQNIERLKAEAARTTLGFWITATRQEDYIITDTLIATVDGNINFATTDYLIFKAGEDYAEVEAVCETVGIIGNGFIPGQIDKLISDEFLHFKEVSNVTVSAGGSEEEEDIPFYNRMRESLEAFTTAGPRGGYRYHAKSVSSLISDASAESTIPGQVDVKIMLYGGELPDEELIQKVQEYLSADDIRPMTDTVTVSAPDTVEFDIEAVYYISREKIKSTNEIKSAVESATENFILWQTQRMGRDINPSFFNSVLMESGIKRVEIIKPEFTSIPVGSVAMVNNVSVTFGGVEDE